MFNKEQEFQRLGRLKNVFSTVGKDVPASFQASQARRYKEDQKRARSFEIFVNDVKARFSEYRSRYHQIEGKLLPRVTRSQLQEMAEDMFFVISPKVTVLGKEIPDWIDDTLYITARIMFEENVDLPTAREKAARIHDRRHRRQPKLATTSGVEIEIVEPEEFDIKTLADQKLLKQLASTYDSIENLGPFITSEAFRELAFPPSKGHIGTITALYELDRLNLIEKMGDHSVHINIGGFKNPFRFVEDLLILHFAFTASNYFGQLPLAAGRPPKIEMPNHSIKMLHLPLESRNFFLPRIDAFVIRDSGVVEFRGLLNQWSTSSSFAKGLTTFQLLSESLAAHTQQDSGSELDTIWMQSKSEIYRIINKSVKFSSGLDFQSFLVQIGEYCHTLELIGQQNEAETLYEIETARDRVHTHTRQQWEQMRDDQEFARYLKERNLSFFHNHLKKPASEVSTPWLETIFEAYSNYLCLIIDDELPRIWADISWASYRNKSFRHEMTVLLNRYRGSIKDHLKEEPSA